MGGRTNLCVAWTLSQTQQELRVPDLHQRSNDPFRHDQPHASPIGNANYLDTLLGFSAQHLDLATGSHETPLHWQSNPKDWNRNIVPESDQSSMTVNLTHTGAPVHLILSWLEKTDNGQSTPTQLRLT